jgi:hypothetical protein
MVLGTDASLIFLKWRDSQLGRMRFKTLAGMEAGIRWPELIRLIGVSELSRRLRLPELTYGPRP